MITTKVRCECCDSGCPCCRGHCEADATCIAYRIDMQDETGTAMCEDCAADAMESGLFDIDETALRNRDRR